MTLLISPKKQDKNIQLINRSADKEKIIPARIGEIRSPVAGKYGIWIAGRFVLRCFAAVPARCRSPTDSPGLTPYTQNFQFSA